MAKVGKKIGKKTQAGKDVYKTPEGKNVSEISTTFKYKGKWINVPSIHKGYEYDVKTLKMMLDAEVIKPTSTHDSRTEAEAEARDRSDRLKFDEGGLATEEERLGFAKSYGVEPVEPMDLTFKDAAKTIAEFTPIIGDVMAAKEVYDELQKDEPNYLLVGALGGAALIGLIPGLGDAAAAAIKTGARKALDVGKRIEVDPDAVGMMGGNVRIKPKKSESFKLDDMYRDDFDWGKLDLTDYQVDAIADAQKSYFRHGGGQKAVEAAEKKVQDAIDARIPAIEEALKNNLKTSDKGVVSLDAYKDAVEATVRFDTVEEAAESISNQRGLLNKMGPGVMDDMFWDDRISGAFEKLPDTETFRYILDNGLDRPLAEWAVKEDAIRKSYNKYKKAANTPKPPRATKGDVDFDAKMAALDEAEDATTWQQNAKKVVKKRGIDLDDKKSPEALELQKSTRLLLENKITRDEHLANVDRLKPVGGYDQLPREPSDKALIFALDAGKRENGLFVLNDKTASKLGAKTSSLKVGDLFNSRLDIPAYKDHDTWIIAGTSPAVKAADGKGVTSYAKAVHFGGDGKPVRFIASPQRSEKIGTGVENKTGYATVSGIVKDLDADAIRAKAAELLNDPEWTQVGFDPRRQGGFYVRAGENKHVPVREATEVIQIGPLVLAKNAKLDMQHQGYNEGGMAMEEQMAMNFGDVPDNTIGQDPVSGNDIPMGSTAENVRDDIPANLSEGEIVVPADVVNFHGVKLFEDLRAEAKMGYAQMAEDGRMGGEPMEDDMEMENDIGLDLADLETMEVPDDAEPVEMRRGGRSMRDYSGAAFKAAQSAASKRNPSRTGRKTHEQIMAQIRGGSSPNDDRPTPVVTAPTPTITAPTITNQSIQEQINWPNAINTMKNTDTKPPVQKSLDQREADLREANRKRFEGTGFINKTRDVAGDVGEFFTDAFGNVTDAFGNIFNGSPQGGKPKRYTGEGEDLLQYKKPFIPALMEGLGFNNNEGGMISGYDEGGKATDNNLIGGTDQFNQPFYAPDQKGGFDMDMAYPDQASGGTGEPVLEMREYMNDQGHRMFITFINGEPQMEIPAGYYPVGEATTMQPVGSTGTTTANYGTSSQNDDPGVEDMVMPEGINYKELSLAELQEMVEDQKSFGSKVFRSLSPVTRLVMWDQTRRTKAELERRRDDPYTSEVDKRRYDTLLELANRDEPGLVATLLNKITGKEPDVPQARTPEQNAALYKQLDKMTKAYTPDVQEASNTTTPGVDDGIDWAAEGAKASKAAADKAFKNNPVYKQKKQDEFIQAVKDDPDSFLPPTPRPSRGQDNNPNRNDSPIFRPPTPAPKPSTIYDNKAAGNYDDDSTGVNKGGIMRKKKKKKSK